MDGLVWISFTTVVNVVIILSDFFIEFAVIRVRFKFSYYCTFHFNYVQNKLIDGWLLWYVYLNVTF